MSQSLLGKIVIEKLAVEFEIINTFRVVCTQLPGILYVDHVELQVLGKEIANLELPTMDQWKTVEKFERSKCTLHTQA